MLQSDNLRVPYVVIKLENVEEDAVLKDSKIRKLENPGNNGRKIFASTVMSNKGETVITNEVWTAPNIFPTGDGGFEVSTFTEFSIQDRHRHFIGTEIYTVLRGKLELYINDKKIPALYAGDEIVVLPGTVHQVCQSISKPEIEDFESASEHNYNNLPPCGSKVSPKPCLGAFQLIVRVHSIACHGEGDKYVQLDPEGEWLVWSSLSPQQRAGAYRL
jgi:quercetin dioxygenase-like cupin family protein